MKMVEKTVRYDKKVVGTVTVPIYESVAELSENELPEYILAQFNKGNVITLRAKELRSVISTNLHL